MTAPMDISIAQALTRAKKHGKRGESAEARRLYEWVLHHDPANKKAKKALRDLDRSHSRAQTTSQTTPQPEQPTMAQYQCLGERVAAGRLNEALAEGGALAERFPRDPWIANLLGACLVGVGRPAEAVEQYRRAVRLKPDHTEALNNLGALYIDLERIDEAMACFRRALAIDAGYADAHFNMGHALRASGDLDGARGCFQAAVNAAPDRAKGYTNLGDTLREQGRLAEAAASFRRAVALTPDDAEAHFNLGVVLVEGDQTIEAVACFERAIALDPRFSAAHDRLAGAYRALARLEAAEASYQRALELDPESADIHANMGNLYVSMGRLDRAVEKYDEAIRWRPDHVDAHTNRALALLFGGEYERGWVEYEWRLKRPPSADFVPPSHLERWRGDWDFSGELVVLHEQGLGDTFQFIRYLAELRRRLPRARRVSFAGPEKLRAVLARVEGVGVFHPMPLSPDAHEAGARWVPLLSLPGLLGVSAEDPVVPAPYLDVDAAAAGRWRARMGAGPESAPESGPVLLVGVAWQGNPDTERANLAGRSFALEALAPLAGVPGVRLVSLQRGAGAEQYAGCSFRDAFVACQEALNGIWAFEEIAELMAACDLVITSDTATAHLAGALGRPTWTLLHHAPDWRWGPAGEATSWYPSMRLFRQSTRGDWRAVMERVATALAARVEGRGEG